MAVVKILTEKQQEYKGVVYYLCGNYYQNNGVRLHRRVYEDFHGEIPTGMHVHHLDGNKANNEPENLVLKSAHDHLHEHMQEEERKAHAVKAGAIMREYAKAWHRGKYGQQFHSNLAKETWKNREATAYTCTQCGKTFYSKSMYSQGAHTFCSNNCKSKYRRDNGLDNETRVCIVCGKEFVINKYARAKTCSRQCGWKTRRQHEDKKNNDGGNS